MPSITQRWLFRTACDMTEVTIEVCVYRCVHYMMKQIKT